MADTLHKRIRGELGFAAEGVHDPDTMLAQGYRGSRYSFGYPACSDLAGRGNRICVGAKEARGDVLFFLHADSMVLPEALNRINEVLSANTEIIGGNFRLVFDGDTPFSRWLTRSYAWIRSIGLYYGDSGIFDRSSTSQRFLQAAQRCKPAAAIAARATNWSAAVASLSASAACWCATPRGGCSRPIGSRRLPVPSDPRRRRQTRAAPRSNP